MGAESKSFEQVYSENFSYIYNYIYMRVLHKETAEDLCSQTFLNAYTHFDSYDPAKAGVRTWLCTIARNLTTNYMTSSSVRLSEAPSHGVPGVVYDRVNKGSKAYMALAAEFLARNES